MQRTLFFAALIASTVALPNPHTKEGHEWTTSPIVEGGFGGIRDGHSTSSGLNPSPTVPTLTGLTPLPTTTTTIVDGSTITVIDHPNASGSLTRITSTIVNTVSGIPTTTASIIYMNGTETVTPPTVTDGATSSVDTTSISTDATSVTTSGTETPTGTAGGSTNEPAAGNSALSSFGNSGWSSTMYGLLSTTVALFLAAA